jgi:hypothetical protein
MKSFAVHASQGLWSKLVDHALQFVLLGTFKLERNAINVQQIAFHA